MKAETLNPKPSPHRMIKPVGRAKKMSRAPADFFLRAKPDGLFRASAENSISTSTPGNKTGAAAPFLVLKGLAYEGT